LAILLDMPRTHVPVLAGELIEALDPQPGQIAVDCTLGGAGHARLVADRLGPTGLLVAIDRDPLAEEAFAELAAEVPCRTRFLRADFVSGLEALRAEGLRADLVYLDLGMSSMQVDTRERGFSYAYDAPLDMRMDPAQALTAAEVVNTWERRRLARALREYGEERYADRIAGEIVRRRAGGEITTTFELVDAITAAIPAPARFGGGHPAKRTFQAIRIAVNEELEQLDDALPLAWKLLRPGGRLAAVAFHSLEDRRVKRFLADRARGCICPPDLPVCACGRTPEAEPLFRRSVAPTPGEIAQNPRAKSARLRAARKLVNRGEAGEASAREASAGEASAGEASGRGGKAAGRGRKAAGRGGKAAGRDGDEV
jgi:16S rRNA (cytosine1402-N4)-methyltransferase